MDRQSSAEQRITELEIKLAFQEDTLAQLNEVVTIQAREIARLTQELQGLRERLAAAIPSNIASEAEETPPPHY